MQKGITISVEKFSSHSAEKFRRGTRLCFRKFRVSKNFMPKRGISRFSIGNLLSHSTEKLRRGTLLCFTKFLVSKKFMDNRGGVSRFSVKYFLSHSAEKFRRGALQCVTNFGYRKDFMLQRVMWRLCVEFFLSHSAEKFRRGILLICVSENVRQRKSLWIRGGGEYQDFPSKIFCLTVPKIFVGEPFSASLISSIEKC